MSHPIHPARAAMVLRLEREHGTWRDEWLSKSERESLNPGGRVFGGPRALRTACQCVLNGLSKEQREIADLQAGILLATDMLSSYLVDNTEEVFEELPEIDDIRSTLIDTFH